MSDKLPTREEYRKKEVEENKTGTKKVPEQKKKIRKEKNKGQKKFDEIDNMESANDFYEDKRLVKQVKKKKRRFRKWVVFLFFIFFLLILIGSSIGIYIWLHDNNDIKNLQNDVVDDTNVNEKEDNENTENINPPENMDDDYWNYIKMNLLEVDFNDLLEKNSDTVGWIQVKGTNINYPIVQTTDNDYYLDHAFDKTENKAGWVFMDYRNNPVDLNQNTIIYAHSRYNGTMFGSLKNILNSSWYTNKENHIIRLSTPTENTMWQVFSVYTIEKESYYITPSFSSTESYQNFLNTIKGRSEVDFSGTVNTGDKVLTLSTCKDNFGNRIVMHAKLIKKEIR